MTLSEKFQNFINHTKMSLNKFVFVFLRQNKSPARQFKVKIETKCLVLSPYIGAESKGLGGLIAQYPKNFEILTLTNGSSMIKNVSQIESINIKKERFFEVMKLARTKGYKIFDINSGTLKDEFKKFAKIDISEADFIFVPNIFDGNPDSAALLSHFKKILKTKEHKKSLQILMYESDCPLVYTDYFADISNISSAKKHMLELYYPENEKLVGGVLGLNKFRAIDLNLNYAEGFMGFYVEDFLTLPLV